MASELIGRCPCPECGFKSAHVKIKTDKENAHPYRHCPDCGAQFFTKNKLQADNLLTMTRAEKPVENVLPAEPIKTEVLEPVPAKKAKYILGVRVPS